MDLLLSQVDNRGKTNKSLSLIGHRAGLFNILTLKQALIKQLVTNE
jgi:antitoxin component HigA of HigAB toxin-antitoxin module